eukprot:4018221-Prymnesium_polylepis.1
MHRSLSAWTSTFCKSRRSRCNAQASEEVAGDKHVSPHCSLESDKRTHRRANVWSFLAAPRDVVAA